MMSRRARIKGIANIPVRRKNETTNTNINEEPRLSTETDNTKEQIANEINKNPLDENINIKTESSSENFIQINHHKSTHSHTKQLISDVIEAETNDNQNVNSAVEKNDEQYGDNKNNTCLISEPELNKSTESKPMRRWIPKPKPTVKIATAARRPKPVLILPPVKDLTDIPNNQNIENELPTTPVQIEETPPDIAIPENDATTKLISDSIMILTSPLSPSKILNRARIRPTPKLIRRNSVQGSASESEDDGRRSHNRIRNDSVCSVTSVTTTETVSVKDQITAKERIVSIKMQQKLFRRSDQSRKVSEARREFYNKFGSKIPDKKRLTMMDLIYYNPVTNPMPPRKNNATSEETIVEVQPVPIEVVEEEKNDDPDDPKSEDETPVPQVKVGPNGEIILDEQSLVIEQTGTKKGREQLANSQIVNVDDLNRAYGIYKRPKRTKGWSAMETLRFYRSLHTVGTDFSLMVALFPGRTRRELKIKFKKEEKINRALIDKALTNPVEFDLSELEKQLKEDEELIEKNQKEEKPKVKRTRAKRKSSSSVLAAQMEEEDDDKELECTRKMITRPKRNNQRKDLYCVLENGLDDIIKSDTDSEEEYIPAKIMKCNLSEKSKNPSSKPDELETSDEENVNKEINELQKQEVSKSVNNNNTINNNDSNDTRITDINIDDDNVPIDLDNIIETSDDRIIENNNDDDTLILKKNIESNDNRNEDINNDVSKNAEKIIDDEENTSKPEDVNCALPNILPNELSTVEPGSLMILTSLGQDGQRVYKVFMVTPGQTKIPINLSQDVVQTLAKSLGTAEAVTLDLPVINDENNVDSEIMPEIPT